MRRRPGGNETGKIAAILKKFQEIFIAAENMHAPTREARTRWHRPHYVLEQDIADHNGRVLYPKGYAFNPLAYIQLPSRIVVIGDSPDYIAWLKQHAHPLDMVLTAGGDQMALSERYGRPVFLLEPTLRERLAVQVVPSIVQQKGDALSIQELMFHEQTQGTETRPDSG